MAFESLKIHSEKERQVLGINVVPQMSLGPVCQWRGKLACFSLFLGFYLFVSVLSPLMSACFSCRSCSSVCQDKPRERRREEVLRLLRV